MMPFLREVALLVDVTLDNDKGSRRKIGGGENMQQQQLLVGVDVGCHKHNVAIGGPNGMIDQFEITHDSRGFSYFLIKSLSRLGDKNYRLSLSVWKEQTAMLDH
jgi:hypothetical protein